MTIRDARTNEIYDVESDGRRITLIVPLDNGDDLRITMSRDDLLELLGVKP